MGVGYSPLLYIYVYILLTLALKYIFLQGQQSPVCMYVYKAIIQVYLIAVCPCDREVHTYLRTYTNVHI